MSPRLGSLVLASGYSFAGAFKTKPRKEGLEKDTAMPKSTQILTEYFIKWDFTRTFGSSLFRLYIGGKYT